MVLAVNVPKMQYLLSPNYSPEIVWVIGAPAGGKVAEAKHRGLPLMRKKQFALSILWIAVLSALAFAQTTTRPNVLLVLSDDHSAAHVGAYGNAYVKTPNLDAFAKEGMLFKRAYV